jgi:hypothetical protein
MSLSDSGLIKRDNSGTVLKHKAPFHDHPRICLPGDRTRFRVDSPGGSTPLPDCDVNCETDPAY